MSSSPLTRTNAGGRRAGGSPAGPVSTEPAHAAASRASRPHGAGAGASARRIPALDGLRALAIAGVVLYHTRPSLLPGGFLGVTLFFVLTGYLATRSITREVGRTGSFAYGRYLVRRVARLVPPVLALIALTAALTWVVSPSLLPKVQSDALPAGLFFLNWSYILREVSYFAAAGLPSPLTHLWYASVTLQFYLVWPLALAGMIFGLKTRRRAVAAAAALALASSAAMALLYSPDADTARFYYGTDTRAAELLAGAVAALALPLIARRRTARDARSAGAHRPAAIGRSVGAAPDAAVSAGAHRAAAGRPNASTATGAHAGTASTAVAVLALAALAAGFVLADGESPLMYRGGYLAAALVAAVLVGAVQQPGCAVARMLSTRPLVWLGSRSFSLYLVHYPLLIFMNPATRTTAVAWWEWIIQFAVLLVAAEAFYRAVESPAAALARRARRSPAARESRPGPRAAHRMASASCTVLTLAGVCAVAVLAFAPVDWQGVADARALALRPELAGDPAEGGADADGGTGNEADAPSADAGADATVTDDAPAGPVAEKVPENLPWQDWTFDEAAGTCSARALIIGDSVTAGAAPALQAALPQALVDGEVARQLYVGQDVYAADTASGFDPEVVVFALGGNSLIRDESQVQALIDAVGGKPVYFVTIRSPYPLQDANNEVLRRYADANANVGIIDWCGASENHSEYLVDDGQHLTEAGCAAFAQLIRQALCGR